MMRWRKIRRIPDPIIKAKINVPIIAHLVLEEP